MDIKKDWPDTKKLFGRPVEDKWEYVFGGDLYLFLQNVKKNVPEDSSFTLIDGLEHFKRVRAEYYLYPRTVSPVAGYICVYGREYTVEEGWKTLYNRDRKMILRKMT
ncbi:MAG: hypothetical protein HQL30_00905 [Candidatus Omnitrophica bacterium]|nr:hypothetical protein [Candidatus Omnitrophota bacterium]